MLLNCVVESPLDSKEIQTAHSKGNQYWLFIGRTDAEAETSILRPSDVKNWLIGKDPDAGKNEGRRRRGWQRMKCLDGITNSMDMSMSKIQETVKDREACCAAAHGVTNNLTRLSDWSTTTKQMWSVSGVHSLSMALKSPAIKKLPCVLTCCFTSLELC